MHWAAHGNTAAEIIYERVDATEPLLRDILHDIPIQELSQPRMEATVRELVTPGRESEAMQLIHLTTGMSIDEAYEHIDTLSSLW